VESIVQHTKWPTKPVTLARQLHQLDSKKQQQDPLKQLQETLQDNHLLLEKLSAEEQRSTRVEAELAATCQREAELRDKYEEFVKTSKQQQEEAATSYRTGREELIKKEYQDQRTISMLQRVTADQATQIENLQEQLALSERNKLKVVRQLAVVAESGAKQFKELTQAQQEVGQLSLKVSAAEQLNKQLQQENSELQEEVGAAEQLNKLLQQQKAELQDALDRLESAQDCAADEPGTPVQRISSTMFSCCEVAA
jgi:chromosome segregation ATPase